MAAIFDYLSWRGDLTFKQAPLNPVDNIILTHLSYLPLNGIVPGPEDADSFLSIEETAERLEKTLKKPGRSEKRKFIFKDDPELLSVLGSCPRFRNMKLAGFINEHDLVEEKQFAALTIHTEDDSVFISYRGTDDTLVGWKEDFKLTFSDEIPSQIEAVNYLETMAKTTKKTLRTGGHSKGGNLSVYAASFCSKKTRERIKEIYINDAPGFNDKVMNSEGYREIREKILSFVPISSVVGMLFDRDYNNTVVMSSKYGLLQHDIYSWEVMGNDLVRAESVNKESRFIDSTIREWMNSLNKEQLKEFTEILFNILASAEVNSFTELGTDWIKSSMLMIQSFGRMKGPSRDMIFKALIAFFKSAQNNIRILLPEEIKADRRNLRSAGNKSR